MIKLKLDDESTQIIADFDGKSARLAAKLVQTMTVLMTKLQLKAKANLQASQSPKAKEPTSGRLEASIKDPQARITGKQIVGTVAWGEGLPYAKIQEYGGIKAYVINPLGEEGTKGAYQVGKFGQVYWRRGHLKGAIKRYGANVLQFVGVQDGKLVYSPSVFKKTPLPGRHFMSGALEQMKEEIKEDLRNTILGEMRITKK